MLHRFTFRFDSGWSERVEERRQRTTIARITAELFSNNNLQGTIYAAAAALVQNRQLRSTEQGRWEKFAVDADRMKKGSVRRDLNRVLAGGTTCEI
jgi:hypothetical protein